MSLIGKLLGLLHPEHKKPVPLQEGSQVFPPPQADDADASSFRAPGGDAAHLSIEPIAGAKEKTPATSRASSPSTIALPTAPQSIMERRKAVEELVTVKLSGTIAQGARFTIPTSLAQNAVRSPLHWVVPGELLEVQGIQLSCGLLYTGLDPHGDEPSLIHSNWPIERVWNQSSENSPYNPAYASLTPSQRFRYLDWLGKGAIDPGVDPGFAMLRMFGLERRLVLEDACITVEAALLLTEIERLQQLFGSNWALLGSAHRLKQYVYLRRELANPTRELPPMDAASSFEFPISIAFGLGRFAKQGTPLPVQWALRWALTDPMISRRTAVERCPKEFAAAFTASYQRRFGDGIKLPQNKTHLKYIYRASSRSVTGSRLEVALGDLPDVTAVQGPRKKLQEVVEEGTHLIDSYSRFVGRYQKKAASIEAYFTLPITLWPSHVCERIEALRDRAAGMHPSTFAELLTQLGHVDDPSTSLARDLATVLTSLQVGFEPDVLEGARRPAAGDKVVFFPLTSDILDVRNTGAYRNASTLVSLMAILSLADGHASELELQAVERRIASWHDLAPDLRTRLRAQYRLQVEQPPALASIKSRIAGCDEIERLNIGRALAAVANADGAATPDEVRLLEQLYRALRLDPQLVYRHLCEPEGDTLILDKRR